MSQENYHNQMGSIVPNASQPLWMRTEVRTIKPFLGLVVMTLVLLGCGLAFRTIKPFLGFVVRTLVLLLDAD